MLRLSSTVNPLFYNTGMGSSQSSKIGRIMTRLPGRMLIQTQLNSISRDSLVSSRLVLIRKNYMFSPVF